MLKTHRLHKCKYGWMFGHPGPRVKHMPTFAQGWVWFITDRVAVIANDWAVEKCQ